MKSASHKSHFYDTSPPPKLTNETNHSGNMQRTSPNTTADEDEVIAVAARLMHQLSKHCEESDSSHLQSKTTDSHLTCSSPRPGTVLTPNDGDVLSGRGAGVNHHPGNTYYRKLIQSQKLSYINANAPDKKKIIHAIVSTVQSKSGRFLKRNTASGSWECLTLDEAKKKTGQALREDAPKIKRMSIINERRRSSPITSRGEHLTSEPFHIDNATRFMDHNRPPMHDLDRRLLVTGIDQDYYGQGQGLKWQRARNVEKPHWITNRETSEMNEQLLQRQHMPIPSALPMITPRLRYKYVPTSTTYTQQFPRQSPYSSISDIPFCYNEQGMISTSEVPMNVIQEWTDEWNGISNSSHNVPLFSPCASSAQDLPPAAILQHNRRTPSIYQLHENGPMGVGKKRRLSMNYVEHVSAGVGSQMLKKSRTY